MREKKQTSGVSSLKKDRKLVYDRVSEEGYTPLVKVGQSVLVAERDKMGYWQAKMSPKGRIPSPLEGKFTHFNDLLNLAKMYAAGVI